MKKKNSDREKEIEKIYRIRYRFQLPVCMKVNVMRLAICAIVNVHAHQLKTHLIYMTERILNDGMYFTRDFF